MFIFVFNSDFMKKCIQSFFVLNILFLFTLQAQEFEGIAYYTSIFKDEVKLDSTKMGDPGYMQFVELMSKPFLDEYVLKFSGSESNFNIQPKLKKPEPAKEKGMIISITLMPSGEILYKNLSKKIQINNKEIYGKQFLIVDSLKNNHWKLEKESKMIGDYTCFKATLIESEKPIDDDENFRGLEIKERIITAWYTPQIPIKNGPMEFSGLPGLILEVKEGNVRFLCTKIILNPAEPIEIIIPTKGKKVSSAEFNDIMKRKNTEMMESFKNKKKNRN